MVHSTLSPSPKAWCLQHKQQKGRRISNIGMTKPVRGVPCSGGNLHQGTTEPPQGLKTRTTLDAHQLLSKRSRYLPGNMFAQGKSAPGMLRFDLVAPATGYLFSALKQEDAELKLSLKAWEKAPLHPRAMANGARRDVRVQG